MVTMRDLDWQLSWSSMPLPCDHISTSFLLEMDGREKPDDWMMNVLLRCRHLRELMNLIYIDCPCSHRGSDRWYVSAYQDLPSIRLRFVLGQR